MLPVDGICSCYLGVGMLDTFQKPKGRCFSSWRPHCIREASRAELKPFAIAFPVFCTWPFGFETIPKTSSLSNAKTSSPLFKVITNSFYHYGVYKIFGKVWPFKTLQGKRIPLCARKYILEDKFNYSGPCVMFLGTMIEGKLVVTHPATMPAVRSNSCCTQSLYIFYLSRFIVHTNVSHDTL